MNAHVEGGSLPVAVVGAGAGGLPAALALARAGRSVLLIERGGLVDRTRIQTTQYDYEVRSPPWEQGEGEWGGSVTPVRALGVGGSTLHFQAVSHRPPLGVLNSWGLREADLASAFLEAEQVLGVTGLVEAPHPLNPVSRHALAAARQLGWRCREAPVAINVRARDGRPACNYCGQCQHGCLPGDRSSADLAWWPRADQTGRVRLLTRTRVLRLETGAAGHVTAVHVQDEDGIARYPVAGVVLAAGAVETPRLLQYSTRAGAEGLDNPHIGHHLTGTLWQALVALLPRPLSGGHAGIPVDVHVDEFESDGFQLALGRGLGSITGPIRAAQHYARPKAGPGLRAWMRDAYPRLAVFAGFAESSTGPGDSVDGERRRIEKALRSEDTARVTRLSGLLREWARAADGELLEEYGSRTLNVSRAMLRGTCRMSASDGDGACTPEGLLRGTDNVVVADASLLGRGLIANPSLTIQALGLYVGGILAARLQV